MNVSRFRTAFGVFLAAAVSLAPGVSWAQSDTGSVDGRVFDETKAAVPGATITARNQGTGLTRSVTTTASGTYRIVSLPAGSYEISVELTGFAKQVRKDVAVQVGTTPTVDFTMSVSAQTEVVEVVGDSALIQTSTSDVGQVITEKLVDNLPLNGRKFQDLSLLVPGTRNSNYYDPTKTEVGGISYGGATGRSVVINVDGGDNNDGVVRGLLQQISNDAIQEFKVTTQRYSAEFGRSTGGVVNVITKSGSNDFHGTAFLFARDQRLNARTYFEEQTDSEKPDFDQQQFGGSLGGPIARDRAHFFAAYEHNRRNESTTVFTNGLLPGEEGQVTKPFRNHLLTSKLDFRLNDSNNLLVRYSLEDNRRENDFVGGNAIASNGALNTNKTHSAIAKNTSVLGNSKVNEFLILYQRFENNITANDNTIPQIVTPDFTAGANANTPQQTIQKRLQLRDDFSFRKQAWGGDHDFKVGAELLKSHYGGFFIPTLYGYFNFPTSIPGARSVADYLNAEAATFIGSAGTNQADDDWTYVAGYIQDDWKPNPRLTLNLGLRYEVQTGPYSNKFRSVAKDAVAAAGFEGELKDDRDNFGPRVGFAYDVNGDAKLVVRGGYGKYYDEIFQNITLYEAWSDPATALNFVTVTPTFSAADYIRNTDAIRNSFLDPTFAGQAVRLTAPDLQQPYAHHGNIGFSIAPARTLAFDVDYVYAAGKQEIHRWDINTAENRSTRLSPAGRFAPQYGQFIVQGNRGHSAFHGVYVAAKARSSRLTGIATYTWSKAKNLANDFGSRPGDITNADWESDYGLTPNDVRHRVTAGVVYLLPANLQVSSSFQFNTGKPYNALAGLVGRRNAVRAVDPATGRPFERHTFTGPDFLTWDMRLSKIFDLGQSRSFEVLFEVFNLTNHVNFNGDPAFGFINNFNSPNFGTATQIIPNSQRQAEFGVRFRF